MASYFKDYFLGNVKALSEDKIEDLVDINSIKDYVDRKAKSDYKYNAKQALKDEYPIDSEILAQIVSVQDYGFFVEFDLNGSGLIHKSKFGNVSTEHLNVAEEGDWVIAGVLGDNTEHNNFDLKLVEV